MEYIILGMEEEKKGVQEEGPVLFTCFLNVVDIVIMNKLTTIVIVRSHSHS